MNDIKNVIVNCIEYMGVNNYHKVTNNIYLGNYKSSYIDIIEKEGFEVVINCTPYMPFYSQKTKNYRINVNDDGSLDANIKMTRYLDIILPIIRKYDTDNKKILIHCRGGVQRSATLVVSYLMKYENMSMVDAIYYVKKRRPIVYLGGYCCNFNMTLLLVERYFNNS